MRGTTASNLGFPSHPNRDVPSFYAANKFKGWPEFLTSYKHAYVTASNPIFDHTLPFVERFFGKNWNSIVGEDVVDDDEDSLVVDLALKLLEKMPTDKPW